LQSKDAQQQKKAREELLMRKKSTDSIQAGLAKSAEYSLKEMRGGGGKPPTVPSRTKKGEGGREGEDNPGKKNDSSPVGPAYSGGLLSGSPLLKQTKKGEEREERDTPAKKNESSPVGAAYSGALLVPEEKKEKEKEKESSSRKLFLFRNSEK
jgi:hypothetical protein